MLPNHAKQQNINVLGVGKVQTINGVFPFLISGVPFGSLAFLF